MSHLYSATIFVFLWLYINIVRMILPYTGSEKRYDELIKEAKSMTQKSYAPYSHFNVGAAVLLSDGTVVTGANQENAAYGECICAERVALLYATANHPDVRPEAIAIAAFANGRFTEECIKPCGSCRQVLLEAEHRYGSDIKIIMYGDKEIYIADSVKDMMPLSFGCGILSDK